MSSAFRHWYVKVVVTSAAIKNKVPVRKVRNESYPLASYRDQPRILYIKHFIHIEKSQ